MSHFALFQLSSCGLTFSLSRVTPVNNAHTERWGRTGSDRERQWLEGWCPRPRAPRWQGRGAWSSGELSTQWSVAGRLMGSSGGSGLQPVPEWDPLSHGSFPPANHCPFSPDLNERGLALRPTSLHSLSCIPGSGRLLEKEMAAHPSVPAWRIPRTEDSGGLQSMGRKELGTTERFSLSLLKQSRRKGCQDWEDWGTQGLKWWLRLHTGVGSFPSLPLMRLHLFVKLCY